MLLSSTRWGDWANWAGVRVGLISSLVSTVPLMLSTLLGSAALLVTVTVLLNTPGRPALLYMALMMPVLPGITGVLVQSGVVQPQLACTLEMMMGWLPVFLKRNSCVAMVPSGTLPKSCRSFSNCMTPWARLAKATTNRQRVSKCFMEKAPGTAWQGDGVA